MSSELIAALCCFYHLGIFRVVEPYTPRTIIGKQRNPHAFLYLQGLCFSVRTCTCANRDTWNWNRVHLPSRDNIFVSKYLLFICLFIYIMTWSSPFSCNLWEMWSCWWIAQPNFACGGHIRPQRVGRDWHCCQAAAGRVWRGCETKSHFKPLVVSLLVMGLSWALLLDAAHGRSVPLWLLRPCNPSPLPPCLALLCRTQSQESCSAWGVLVKTGSGVTLLKTANGQHPADPERKSWLGNAFVLWKNAPGCVLVTAGGMRRAHSNCLVALGRLQLWRIMWIRQ